MQESEKRLRETLARIANLAGSLTDEGAYFDIGDANASQEDKTEYPSCILKSLPPRLLIKAASTAATINPVNRPFSNAAASMEAMASLVSEPMRIAVLTTKYWGPSPRTLTVSFMETTPGDLKARIISHMNAWTKTGCITFTGTSGTGDVRISREPGGYYSYLGTDILHIPKNRQTMNLEAFTMNTPESEYKRVVRHETGHTLGAPHEHMRKALVARIDPARAYAYFLETQGWDKATVDAQVLAPLDETALMSTPADQTSIMCYQLPGSITKDGKPIVGGIDINPTDYSFIGKIYPRPHAAASAVDAADEWAESEDVPVEV